MTWYLKVLRQYTDFRGRARRTEYWMFTLITIVIGIVLAIVDLSLGLTFGGPTGAPTGVLGSLYSLATLVPSLAVGARRLHDTGRTGWLQLAVFVPLVLALAVPAAGTAGTTLGVVGLLLSLILLVAAIVLIVFYATDGTPGSNRWGPNPKELTGPPVA